MDALLTGLDEFIETLRNDYQVPGVAVSIVRGGQLAYARGFGVREQGGSDPVDDQTIFAIGSCTKAFTAMAVGMLVQEGKLAWDDKVTRYLPGFQLYDPVDTREITIRDLLCHRVGLPTFGGDFMGYGSRYTDAEAFERIRHIPPAYRLRAGYGYANLMFLTAGLVIREVSGMSWADFISERLLVPLGMVRTRPTEAGLHELANVAQPHQLYAGKLTQVPYSVFNNGAAAGAMVSTVADMALWLQFQLNNGRVGDKQLVNEAIMLETRTPHALIQIPAEFRTLITRRHFQAYGLGWFLEDYGGRLVVSHSGGVDGMQALTIFLPEEQFGVTILANRIPTYLNSTLFRHLLDRQLGFSDRDWRADFLEMHRRDQEKAAEQQRKREETRPAGTRPSLPLSGYTGTYQNPIYGEVKIVEEDGRLVIHLGGHSGVTGPLEHWHTDTFFCRWSSSSLEESFIPFSIGLDGKAETLKIKVADFVDPLVYVFTRV